MCHTYKPAMSPPPRKTNSDKTYVVKAKIDPEKDIILCMSQLCTSKTCPQYDVCNYYYIKIGRDHPMNRRKESGELGKEDIHT